MPRLDAVEAFAAGALHFLDLAELLEWRRGWWAGWARCKAAEWEEGEKGKAGETRRGGEAEEGGGGK